MSTDAMIHFPCPNCRKPLKARPEHAGQKCRCTRCQAILNIPPAESTVYEPPPRVSSSTALVPDVPGSTVEDDEPIDVEFIVKSPKTGITIFQKFLIITALLFTAVVILAIVGVSLEDQWMYAALHQRWRGDDITTFVITWFVVMVVLGAVFQLTEMARNSRKR